MIFRKIIPFFLMFHSLEGQAWCSGESCLTESPGRGFEAASPQILWGKGLSRFIPSPDPTHVEASGTGSALFYAINGFSGLLQLSLRIRAANI